MNKRRSFMKVVVAGAVPAAIGGVVRAADGIATDITGAWTTLHTSPFGPFRELLIFSTGGGMTETNALLHTGSNLNLSEFGLPAMINGSDGLGNWQRLSSGQFQVVFPKVAV